MIANCGQLGIDWERASLSAYLEALEAHNEIHDPKGAKGDAPPPSPELKRFAKAHMG